MIRRRYFPAIVDYSEILVATGDEEKAIRLLSEAIAAEPSGYLYERRAHLLREAGRYEEALPDLDRAAELLPENPMVWYTRGITYRRLDRLEEAAADLRACILHEDEHSAITTYYELGSIYYEMRDFKSALECFLQASSDPDRVIPIFYYYTALSYYQLDQNQAAIDYTLKAIDRLNDFQFMPDQGLQITVRLSYSYGAFETFQKQMESWYGFRLLLANIYAEENQVDEAIAALTSGLELYPEAADLLLRRAELYRENGQYAEAKLDLDAAKRQHPALPKVYLEHSALYRDQGLEEQARAELEALIAIQPDLAIPYYLLAESYLREEKAEQALQANLQLIAIEEDDPLNYIQQGEIYKQMYQAEEAEQAYTRAIELEDIPDFRLKRSFIYFVQHRFEEAWKDLEVIPALDQAFAQTPYYHKAAGYVLKGLHQWELAISSLSRALGISLESDAELYETMGECYMELEQWDSAVRMATLGMEKDPGNRDLIYLRGQASYRLGDYEAALKDIRRFNEDMPEQAIKYYNLGVIYQEMDREELALQEYDRALSLDMGHAGSHYRKAQIYYSQMQFDLCVAQLVQWGLFIGGKAELTLEERIHSIEQLPGFSSDILGKAAAELSEFYGNRPLLS
ncbi:tetratricopeptide repeat protein [Paenibacillus sp. CAA11]|uniref:tetratricopeptide repeat protein n=1 Tax=Paenibacillus sp. CAA11 TaxID=1532905 RepID=UPI00131F2FA1|nr:tetratricopeptide repeat protein [Paenibacillus sp. CAA11]